MAWSSALLHQSVSHPCDICLGFALAQLPIGFAEFSVGFSEALGEVLAVLLVLLTWLLHWKVESLHCELP